MSEPGLARNFTVIPNVTPEELASKKREAADIAVRLALECGLGTSPEDIAIQDIAPEDLGISGNDIAWSAPGSAGWNKVVDSVKADNKVVVFYGIKSKNGDPAVGIRFTQGQNKDLQIRGEYHLHTVYNNVEREANAVFPELIKYKKDEYINLYLRFKEASASVLIPLAVVAKPKSQVVG